MAFTWTFLEVLDIFIMTAAIGYIFHDVFRMRPRDVVSHYLQRAKGFVWNDFWFACSVVAPAILLHELGHKVAAILSGLTATFHAAYGWLVFGIVLKLVGFGFIFFVPAFVSISGGATPLQYSLVAFAGPFVNLVLWLASFLALKYASELRLSIRARYYFQLSKQINIFLFIFNILPIPGFDGLKVFQGLFSLIF